MCAWCVRGHVLTGPMPYCKAKPAHYDETYWVGLSYDWSLMRVIFHRGGLLPGCSVIRMVSRQRCLSSG